MRQPAKCEANPHLDEPYALHNAAEAASCAGQHTALPHHLQDDADGACPHGQRQHPMHALIQGAVLLVSAHYEALDPKGERKEGLRRRVALMHTVAPTAGSK